MILLVWALTLFKYIVCTNYGANDAILKSWIACQSLESLSEGSTETILTSEVQNYLSCCNLCKYQRGCSHFRWEGQGGTCRLLRASSAENTHHCIKDTNPHCVPNPCVYPEVFVPVKGATDYICLKAQTERGSGCTSVQDCGGGLHTECTDSRCRCQLGYLHSVSQLYCLTGCDVPSDVYEGYIDRGVRDYNNDDYHGISVEQCRSLCTQVAFDCRHIEYRRDGGRCLLSDKTWFGVGAGSRVLDDPGFTLNLRQCT